MELICSGPKMVINRYIYFRHIGTSKSSPTNKFRTQSSTKSLTPKETLGIERKKFLPLQVDLHVEEEGKFTSTLTDSIEGGMQSKHENDNSIDQKSYHSDREKNVESDGTICNGMNIDVR